MTTETRIIIERRESGSRHWNAMPKGGSERDVMTVITRPLWKIFLCVLGEPVDSEPTEWQGMKTLRVCGSYTVVIESEQFAAVSFPMRAFASTGN